MSRQPRRIVSAAIMLNDSRVVMCVRHLDTSFFRALGIDRFVHHTDEEIKSIQAMLLGHIEGFVDNDGEFLTREEAWPIAEAQQTLIDPDWCRGSLHSEHLY